jgi:hypothetical protein
MILGLRELEGMLHGVTTVRHLAIIHTFPVIVFHEHRVSRFGNNCGQKGGDPSKSSSLLEAFYDPMLRHVRRYGSCVVKPFERAGHGRVELSRTRAARVRLPPRRAR